MDFFSWLKIGPCEQSFQFLEKSDSQRARAWEQRLFLNKGICFLGKNWQILTHISWDHFSTFLHMFFLYQICLAIYFPRSPPPLSLWCLNNHLFLTTVLTFFNFSLLPGSQVVRCFWYLLLLLIVLLKQTYLLVWHLLHISWYGIFFICLMWQIGFTGSFRQFHKKVFLSNMIVVT